MHDIWEILWSKLLELCYLMDIKVNYYIVHSILKYYIGHITADNSTSVAKYHDHLEVHSFKIIFLQFHPKQNKPRLSIVFAKALLQIEN